MGLFATDDALFLVPGDSPIQTWDDWVAAAQADRLVVGGIGTVNVDFIVSRPGRAHRPAGASVIVLMSLDLRLMGGRS